MHLKGHFGWMRQQQPVPANHHFRFSLMVCLSSLMFGWRWLFTYSFMIYNPHVWVLWPKPKLSSLACCSKAPSAVWLSASVFVTIHKHLRHTCQKNNRTRNHHSTTMESIEEMVWNRNNCKGMMWMLWTLTVCVIFTPSSWSLTLYWWHYVY